VPSARTDSSASARLLQETIFNEDSREWDIFPFGYWIFEEKNMLSRGDLLFKVIRRNLYAHAKFCPSRREANARYRAASSLLCFIWSLSCVSANVGGQNRHYTDARHSSGDYYLRLATEREITSFIPRWFAPNVIYVSSVFVRSVIVIYSSQAGPIRLPIVCRRNGAI